VKALFVGTLDGIFKVVQPGGKWTVERSDLAGAEVNALVIHPVKREVVYAGVRGGGLSKSENSGRSWQRLGDGVLSDKVRALTLDPSNPQVLYVGTEPPGLWKSEDGGRTWSELVGLRELALGRGWTYPVPKIEPHVRCITVDANDSKRIWVAAQVGGIAMSEDGGSTWTDVREPIDMDVHNVVIDPRENGVLYAATGGGENFPSATPFPKGRPLYRSKDGGRSWQCITKEFTRTYSVPVRVHPKDSRCLFLGVAEEPPPVWLHRSNKANGALVRSSDGGGTWQTLLSGLPDPFLSMVECIDFDPDRPDRVFIGTGGEGARFINLNQGEIYHSLDRGDHWEKIPVAFPIIYALAVQ